MSRKKAKGKGAAKKSGKDSKKSKSTKKSTTKSTKRTPRRPTEKPATKLKEMPTKDPAKKDERNDAKKPVDMVQARENVSDLVKEAAADIANGVIKVAKTGQLASAKYLFEAVGLYPATGQMPDMPVEDSLAHTLLRRMGLPLEPVVPDDDDVPIVPTSDAREMSGKDR